MWIPSVTEIFRWISAAISIALFSFSHVAKKWLEGKIAGLGLSGIKSHKCKTAVALFKLLQESCNLSTLGSKTL